MLIWTLDILTIELNQAQQIVHSVDITDSTLSHFCVCDIWTKFSEESIPQIENISKPRLPEFLMKFQMKYSYLCFRHGSSLSIGFSNGRKNIGRMKMKMKMNEIACEICQKWPSYECTESSVGCLIFNRNLDQVFTASNLTSTKMYQLFNIVSTHINTFPQSLSRGLKDS
jgi:hypothetical protein